MPRLSDGLKLLRLGDVAVRRNPWFYSDARRVLDELEKSSIGERREWTHRRLEEVLWSARRSPYGKRVRGTKDLHSWPLLRKPEVQAAPRSFCTHSPLLSVQSTTGGTSGMPLKIFRSLQSVAFEQACMDEMMRRLGVDGREARTAVLRTDAIKDPNDLSPPYWIHANGGRRLVFSSSHLSTATITAFAKALEDFKPDLMMAYPTSLEALCTLLAKHRLKVHVPRVVCSSEMLRAQIWESAVEQLGCTLLDRYGQAERVAFAYATVPGEYRFLPGYAHIELDRVGTEEGERAVYEIVGTALWNRSMSLVRYCTGDLIHLPSSWGAREIEEVALGVRPFGGVFGRSGDILLTPEGAKVTGISHFHRDVQHVHRIQIIQESVREVSILVLAASGYSAADEQHLLRNVRRKLPDSMNVVVRPVQTLERTTLGKTPFVIHRPAVRSLLESTPLVRGHA